MRTRLETLFALTMVIAVASVIIATNAIAESAVSINDVPEAVRTTIQHHVGQGQILEIEPEEENGQAVYDVEFILNGQTSEFQISSSGEYLGPDAEEKSDDNDNDDGDNNEDGDDDAEESVEWAQVPQAVQAGITAVLGGATPGAVTREEEGGVVYYEAQYEANGTEHAIKLTDDGQVIETEEEVATASLPAAVAAAVRGEIKKAELVTVTFYEIEVKRGEDVREVKLFSNGQVFTSDGDNDGNHGNNRRR